MLWSIDSCQNSVSADHYRVTVSRAQVSTHWFRMFFSGIIRWQVTTFQMIAGSNLILKLKNFDFKRTSDAKIQAAFTCRKDSRF